MQLTFNNGIEIEGLEFHLDAHRKAEFSFVSHAHTDHIASHKKILATPETILFFNQRYKRTKARALGFNQKTNFGDFSVELFPSGHILGCAQIRIEQVGTKIVYTGDFKLKGGLTAPPAEIVDADVLIMESTYGNPRYVFPDRDKVVDQLITFVQKTLLSNQVPIILAYSLGKAQEAVKILGDFGFELYAEDNVYKFCQLYERCGVKFSNLHPLQVEDFKGKVLVFPPYFRKYKSLFHSIYPKQVCFLSGWGMDNSSRYRVGADLVLPLSDHADYNDLISYVEQSNPRKVFTLHGFPEFAEDLRRRGFDARYLGNGATVSIEDDSGKIFPTAKGNLDLFS
jgi:putative mRNA 3-end processing factor